MPWLKGDQFDSATNYKLLEIIKDFFVTKKLTVEEFHNRIGNLLEATPNIVSHSLLNIIDSHDTYRFLTLCKEDKNLFKEAVLFQMTFLGIPCIYYGDEIGMTGEEDPDCRRCMSWDNIDIELLNFYKDIIKFHKRNKIVAYGDFKFIDVDNKNILAYSRSYKEDNLVVLINNTNSKAKINNSEIEPNGYKLYINNNEIKL
jgi:cyclomaltodextrinase